jgi:hypothetical protein
MTPASQGRRALFVVVGLAAAGAPAYAADDKSTISSVMELVGVSTDTSAAKIDYSERPKLVLPPRAGQLPAPREDAGRPESWPTDAAAARRRNTDRYAHVPNAPEEERKPGLLERALSAGNGNAAPVVDEPNRRMLTEPPSGYRRPTRNLATIVDPDAKKGSWWNPMTYLGGNDAPAAPAAGAPQQQAQPQQQANNGGWFQMPRFVGKDPDKE